MKNFAAAVALSVGLALPLPAAAPRDNAVPAGESAENIRLYQAGLDFYARGNLTAALASFREGLRREPNNRAALTAVLRLESEIAVGPPAVRPPREQRALRASSGLLDRFFLVSVPRWFYFERTIGDPLSDVGTLNALNARVVQLLGEREIALAQNRPFRNDRQLRALLRRAPLAARGRDEV